MCTDVIAQSIRSLLQQVSPRNYPESGYFTGSFRVLPRYSSDLFWSIQAMYTLVLDFSIKGHIFPFARPARRTRPRRSPARRSRPIVFVTRLRTRSSYYLLLTTYYLLLTTHYLLLTTDYLLLTTYYSLLTTHYLLLTTYYLPLTTYCLLLTAYCLLLTAYRLPLTAYCLLLTTYY
jgi:hypothetical protein